MLAEEWDRHEITAVDFDRLHLVNFPDLVETDLLQQQLERRIGDKPAVVFRNDQILDAVAQRHQRLENAMVLVAVRDEYVVDVRRKIGKRVAIAGAREWIADHGIRKDAYVARFDQHARMTEITDSHAVAVVRGRSRRRFFGEES